MNNNIDEEFQRRYDVALRRQLRRPVDGCRASLEIGREALLRGLSALDLARVHARALAATDTQLHRDVGRAGAEQPTQANRFFFGVLTPFDRFHRSVRRREAMGPPDRSDDGSVQGRALAGARRNLQLEVDRRIAGEQRLREVEGHYRKLLERSALMQEEMRRLARQVLHVQEEERKEISRELHDEVAQILAGINVQLATLREVSANDAKGLRRRIGQTQRLVERSVDVVHRYARELRPVMLDDLGLIPALRSYIQDLLGRSRLRIRFNAFSSVDLLDNSRRTVLYRVAQEALTNVVRHAHARLASVSIRKVGGSVRLEVHDDGKSFKVEDVLASNARNRLGLLGMRERIEMVGGVLTIRSEPGTGTLIRAEIPFVETKRRTKA